VDLRDAATLPRPRNFGQADRRTPIEGDNRSSPSLVWCRRNSSWSPADGSPVTSRSPAVEPGSRKGAGDDAAIVTCIACPTE